MNDFMNLKLCSFVVKDVIFSKKSALSGGVLNIQKEEIEKNLYNDRRFKKVYIDVAKPGEMTRIIHTLDIIEPRAKVGEGSRVFPGFLGPPATVGSGTTHRLQNVAVITTADIEAFKSVEGPSSVTGPRERVVDMAGEAAIFSPFSETMNVVLNFEPSPDISMEEFEDAIRMAGLWVAEYLARLTSNMPPDHTENLHYQKAGNDLPKIVYIYMLASDGFLRDTYLYGERTTYLMPTLIHPNEIADGALVNASQSFASSPTYVHQNNKVITGLWERQGKDLNFAGVVVLTRHHLTHQDKERKAYFAAKLAKMLGADGVVSTQEGGGNSIVEQMLIVKFCEELGIKTVTVTYEMGGVQGKDLPLIYQVKEADAVVSTGNREQLVRLPKMERVLGGTHILYKNIPATESYETFMSDIAFSFDQTGFWRVRAWDY